MSQILKGIKFSQDFSKLSGIWRRGIEKWFQIEIRKARAREPQPQCRAHELSIAARYLRERPKYEFVFRIAERMLAQPLHDLAASVGSDRTLAQSRQQSPLRGDSRVSRTVSQARALSCATSRALSSKLSRTPSRRVCDCSQYHPIISRTVMRTVSCSVARSAACAARSSVSHAITRNVLHRRAAHLAHYRANRLATHAARRVVLPSEPIALGAKRSAASPGTIVARHLAAVARCVRCATRARADRGRPLRQRLRDTIGIGPSSCAAR